MKMSVIILVRSLSTRQGFQHHKGSFLWFPYPAPPATCEKYLIGQIFSAVHEFPDGFSKSSNFIQRYEHHVNRIYKVVYPRKKS